MLAHARSSSHIPYWQAHKPGLLARNFSRIPHWHELKMRNFFGGSLCVQAKLFAHSILAWPYTLNAYAEYWVGWGIDVHMILQPGRGGGLCVVARICMRFRFAGRGWGGARSCSSHFSRTTGLNGLSGVHVHMNLSAILRGEGCCVHITFACVWFQRRLRLPRKARKAKSFI